MNLKHAAMCGFFIATIFTLLSIVILCVPLLDAKLDGVAIIMMVFGPLPGFPLGILALALRESEHEAEDQAGVSEYGRRVKNGVILRIVAPTVYNSHRHIVSLEDPSSSFVTTQQLVCSRLIAGRQDEISNMWLLISDLPRSGSEVDKVIEVLQGVASFAEENNRKGPTVVTIVVKETDRTIAYANASYVGFYRSDQEKLKQWMR